MQGTPFPLSVTFLKGSAGGFFILLEEYYGLINGKICITFLPTLTTPNRALGCGRQSTAMEL